MAISPSMLLPLFFYTKFYLFILDFILFYFYLHPLSALYPLPSPPYILNTAARLTHLNCRSNHVTPLLSTQSWFSILFRVKAEVLIIIWPSIMPCYTATHLIYSTPPKTAIFFLENAMHILTVPSFWNFLPHPRFAWPSLFLPSVLH